MLGGCKHPQRGWGGIQRGWPGHFAPTKASEGVCWDEVGGSGVQGALGVRWGREGGLRASGWGCRGCPGAGVPQVLGEGGVPGRTCETWHPQVPSRCHGLPWQRRHRSATPSPRCGAWHPAPTPAPPGRPLPPPAGDKGLAMGPHPDNVPATAARRFLPPPWECAAVCGATINIYSSRAALAEGGSRAPAPGEGRALGWPEKSLVAREGGGSRSW